MADRETASVSGRPLESVWDYPLPPRAEPCELRAQVILNGFLIADSADLLRVVQTGLAPAYYFPPDDVLTVYLRPNGHHTTCSYRGRASYYDAIVDDRTVEDAAWTYHDPNAGFEAIADRIAFYPTRVDACLLDGEAVRSDVGEDTGGWVTAEILGLSRGYPRTWDAGEDT